MALEERLQGVEERVGQVETKVDQVRHAIGLNGDLTPEATGEARKMWDDLRVIVRARRNEAELHDSYEQVKADVARRFRILRHPGKFARWALPLIGGAAAWKLVNSFHIHTPWGPL